MLGNKLPRGFRFCPTDDTLFWLLDLKLKGICDPSDPIPDYINVYGCHPKDLPRPENLGSETEDYYYYVRRRRRSDNATRPIREVPDEVGNKVGTWRGIQQKRPIHNEQGVIIGEKTPGLAFCLRGTKKDKKGKRLDIKTHWLMDEFTLPLPEGSNFAEYAISRIRYNSPQQQQPQRLQGEQKQQQQSWHNSPQQQQGEQKQQQQPRHNRPQQQQPQLQEEQRQQQQPQPNRPQQQQPPQQGEQMQQQQSRHNSPQQQQQQPRQQGEQMQQQQPWHNRPQQQQPQQQGEQMQQQIIQHEAQASSTQEDLALLDDDPKITADLNLLVQSFQFYV